MEIRALGAADIDPLLDVRIRAFGQLDAAELVIWKQMTASAMASGGVLGCVDGDRLVGGVRIHDIEQWWHGRAVPMAGIASVVVVPEDRGRGIGRRIMAAALDYCAQLGSSISTLFPATTPLYRSMGWEHAGAQYRFTLEAEALRRLAGEPVKLRRATPDDAAEVMETFRQVHAAARDCGPLSWRTDSWRDWLAEEEMFSYLADDGFLAYRWDGDQIMVEELVAGSEATLRNLWAIVGSNSSVVKTVTANVSPHDPLLWLLRERSKEDLSRACWMLRVVDAPGAIAGRGFPAGLDLDVPVAVTDPQRSSNSGDWLLSVHDGRGVLTTVAHCPAVRLSIQGLSALYAGVPPSTLRRAGLMAGDETHDGTLGAAFAATPFTHDYF